MAVPELKQREEILQALLKKIDGDIELFANRIETLKQKHEELSNVVTDARLSPVPIHFQSGAQSEDVLGQLEAHVLELNKLKNLLAMKLNHILQEEDLLDQLQEKYGKNVTFRRNAKGLIELQVRDPAADESLALLQQSKKKLDALRGQIHELGDED